MNHSQARNSALPPIRQLPLPFPDAEGFLDTLILVAKSGKAPHLIK